MKKVVAALWMNIDDAIEKTQMLVDEQDIPLGCQGTYDELGDLLPRDRILRFLDAVDTKLRPMGHSVIILPPRPQDDFHQWRIDAPENCVGDEMFPCDRLDDPLPGNGEGTDIGQEDVRSLLKDIMAREPGLIRIPRDRFITSAGNRDDDLKG